MGTWYMQKFGWLPIAGTILIAVAIAPTGVGLMCGIAGVAVFHIAIYSVTKLNN